MKRLLTITLAIAMAFSMATLVAANASVGTLHSVANSWYFNTTAEGVLIVRDNFVDFTYEVDKGENFLGTQSGFKGQLRFVSFYPHNFRHIVIWDFKEGLREEEKASLFLNMKTDLEALTGMIEGIIELRVMRDPFNFGVDNKGEGQIVLDAIFENQAAYNVYAAHQDHLDIAAYVVRNIVENRRGTNFLQPGATKHTDKYRHIVVWGFKDGLNEGEKDFQFNRMKKDLEALVGVIPGLLELNVARDHINPGPNGNGQVALVALFASREAHVDVYTPHPEHQKIAAYVVADIVDNATRRQANFFESDTRGRVLTSQ